MQPAVVRDHGSEQRAVDPAGARAGEDVDDDHPVERAAEGVVDRPRVFAFLLAAVVGRDAVVFDAEVRAAGAVELYGNASHPDREADATVPRHRETHFFRVVSDLQRRGGGG